MEFWGAQVKAGKPLTVKPDQGCLIHVSQASLGKGKKGESVLLYVTVDGKKLVIGTLSHENIPQISFELVFEKEFELSHSLERGSVHFIGYKSHNIDQEEEGDYSSEEEEEVKLPNKAKKRKKSSIDTDEIGDDNMLALKKQIIHKAKSQENDEEEISVPKNEIKEIKKSIKGISKAVKKIQETIQADKHKKSKKQKIHKQNDTEGEEVTVSKNKIEELKKSFKGLSKAVKKNTGDHTDTSRSIRPFFIEGGEKNPRGFPSTSLLPSMPKETKRRKKTSTNKTEGRR